jgi:hypothetical protein
MLKRYDGLYSWLGAFAFCRSSLWFVRRDIMKPMPGWSHWNDELLILAVSTLAYNCQEHKPSDLPLWFFVVLYSIDTIMLGAAERLDGAIFSRQIRMSISKHPVVHLVWIGFAAFFVFCIFARTQTRALSFITVPLGTRLGIKAVESRGPRARGMTNCGLRFANR